MRIHRTSGLIETARKLASHQPVRSIISQQGDTMKVISASIVILAASILLTGGSHIPHSDTALFVQVVGCGVGIVGLWGWFVSFRENKE